MKQFPYKIIIFSLCCFMASGIIKNNEKEDKIQYLQFQNNILHQYKRVYLEHLEKCDTTHQRCFNTNISSIKISPVHTITSCNSQTVFCSSCGNNTISTNVVGMLTKADAG